MNVLSIWIIRLTLGISFFLHGWGKLPYPPEKFASWLESISIAEPMLIASLVAFGEMAAGIGIIAGGLFAGKLGNFITNFLVFRIRYKSCFSK